MTEMVERVARAISAERWNRPEQFDMESESWRNAHRDMARAAIATMREPTEAMIDAIADAKMDFDEPTAEDCKAVWAAGIDAALAKEPR